MPANTERRRGPQKGHGGRRRVPLRNDFPDNQIVAIALWYITRGRAVGTPFLEMLVYLFHDGDFVKTPDDGVGASMRGGAPFVMIGSLMNLRSPRNPGKNYPGGSRRQTPDGRTLMKERARLIRDKIKKHNPAGKFKDQAWLGASFMGLDYLFVGRMDIAMIAFGHAGWRLTGPMAARFRQLLTGLNERSNITL
jgi:hypothetical protein